MSSRSTKSVLAEELLGAISQYNCIPNTDLVDDRQFRIVENSAESDGHIRIRLSRGISNNNNGNDNGNDNDKNNNIYSSVKFQKQLYISTNI